METLARKIIDAIQNSLVGDLVARLFWPIGYLWLIVTNAITPDDLNLWFAIGAAVFWIFGAFTIWLLGALANRSLKRRKRYLSDPGVPLPANGFEAWEIPPQDGLRPPAFMRKLVNILGAQDVRSKDVSRAVFLSLFIALIALMGGLAFSPQFFEKVHPWFASTEHRLLLVHACLVGLTALQIRQWAVDQKRLLAEQDLAKPLGSMSPA